MSHKILSFLFVFSSWIAISQSEWNEYSSIDGVNIFSKDSDCYPSDMPSQKVILFKIENTTNTAVKISWNVRVWYNGKESINNVAPEERTVSFSLDANQTLEGDCALTKKNLYLYKQFIEFQNAGLLTKYILEDIKVTK